MCYGREGEGFGEGVGVGEFGSSGWGVRDGETGVRLRERSSREMVRCTVCHIYPAEITVFTNGDGIHLFCGAALRLKFLAHTTLRGRGVRIKLVYGVSILIFKQMMTLDIKSFVAFFIEAVQANKYKPSSPLQSILHPISIHIPKNAWYYSSSSPPAAGTSS